MCARNGVTFNLFSVEYYDRVCLIRVRVRTVIDTTSSRLNQDSFFGYLVLLTVIVVEFDDCDLYLG